MDKIGRAGGLPYWKGDISASLPLVFTEALSYYQCIYLLYEKMNEIIETVNQLVDFYNAMENYLKILYENSPEDYQISRFDPTPTYYKFLSFRGRNNIIQAQNYIPDSESFSVTVMKPALIQGVIPPDDDTNIYISYMFNGTMRTDVMKTTEASHLIVTNGNAICLYMEYKSSSYLYSLYCDIFKVTPNSRVNPTVYGGADITIKMTDTSVKSVKLYNALRCSVTEYTPDENHEFHVYLPLNAKYYQIRYDKDGVEQRYPIWVINNRNTPYLYPDFYTFTLPNTNDEIIYYNWNGLNQVVCQGQNIQYSKPILNYYSNMTGKFDCFKFAPGFDESPISLIEPELEPTTEYSEEYEAALARARSNLKST